MARRTVDIPLTLLGLRRQFKLHYRGNQPVKLELFAKCSPEVAARIDAGERKLAPAEWRSGELSRLVERVELAPEAMTRGPAAAAKGWGGQ